jgi:hypothetical protein
MDERIANLMRDRGHEDLLLRVDDPGLSDKLMVAMRNAAANREKIAGETGKTVVKHLELLASMGRRLQEYVGRRFPEYATAANGRTWTDFLPPLDQENESLLARHAP